MNRSDDTLSDDEEVEYEFSDEEDDKTDTDEEPLSEESESDTDEKETDSSRAIAAPLSEEEQKKLHLYQLIETLSKFKQFSPNQTTLDQILQTLNEIHSLLQKYPAFLQFEAAYNLQSYIKQLPLIDKQGNIKQYGNKTEQRKYIFTLLVIIHTIEELSAIKKLPGALTRPFYPFSENAYTQFLLFLEDTEMPVSNGTIERIKSVFPFFKKSFFLDQYQFLHLSNALKLLFLLKSSLQTQRYFLSIDHSSTLGDRQKSQKLFYIFSFLHRSTQKDHPFSLKHIVHMLNMLIGEPLTPNHLKELQKIFSQFQSSTESPFVNSFIRSITNQSLPVPTIHSLFSYLSNLAADEQLVFCALYFHHQPNDAYREKEIAIHSFCKACQESEHPDDQRAASYFLEITPQLSYNLSTQLIDTHKNSCQLILSLHKTGMTIQYAIELYETSKAIEKMFDECFKSGPVSLSELGGYLNALKKLLSLIYSEQHWHNEVILALTKHIRHLQKPLTSPSLNESERDLLMRCCHNIMMYLPPAIATHSKKVSALPLLAPTPSKAVKQDKYASRLFPLAQDVSPLFLMKSEPFNISEFHAFCSNDYFFEEHLLPLLQMALEPHANISVWPEALIEDESWENPNTIILDQIKHRQRLIHKENFLICVVNTLNRAHWAFFLMHFDNQGNLYSLGFYDSLGQINREYEEPRYPAHTLALINEVFYSGIADLALNECLPYPLQTDAVSCGAFVVVIATRLAQSIVRNQPCYLGDISIKDEKYWHYKALKNNQSLTLSDGTHLTATPDQSHRASDYFNHFYFWSTLVFCQQRDLRPTRKKASNLFSFLCKQIKNHGVSHHFLCEQLATLPFEQAITLVGKLSVKFPRIDQTSFFASFAAGIIQNDFLSKAEKISNVLHITRIFNDAKNSIIKACARNIHLEACKDLLEHFWKNQPHQQERIRIRQAVLQGCAESGMIPEDIELLDLTSRRHVMIGLAKGGFHVLLLELMTSFKISTPSAEFTKIITDVLFGLASAQYMEFIPPFLEGYRHDICPKQLHLALSHAGYHAAWTEVKGLIDDAVNITEIEANKLVARAIYRAKQTFFASTEQKGNILSSTSARSFKQVTLAN